MAVLAPFKALSATVLSYKMGCPPYSELPLELAKDLCRNERYNFIRVNRSEVDLPPGTDPYSPAVYEQARSYLDLLIQTSGLSPDYTESLHIYRIDWNGHILTGVLGLASVDEYLAGRIKPHQFTREDRETDRARHIEATGSHTGLVSLGYRRVGGIDALVNQLTLDLPTMTKKSPFDGSEHALWSISDPEAVVALSGLFRHEVEHFYLAEGHHRVAAAVRVHEKLASSLAPAEVLAGSRGFPAVAFPVDELRTQACHRVVEGLNGHTPAEFLGCLSKDFFIEPLDADAPPLPAAARTWGLFLDGRWYQLRAKEHLKGPDTRNLQDRILAPVLGIGDPRTDPRLDCVQLHWGNPAELAGLCSCGRKIALFCHPLSVEELLREADAGTLLPPLSSLFVPPLFDGLVIDRFQPPAW